MPKKPDVVTTPETPAPLLHRAARGEDWFHRLRVSSGRRRGLTATIVPFVGYGSTDWVRVLCRVQLRSQSAMKRAPLANARGWRSFTGIQVGNATVRVSAGGSTQEVRADRGGVVDARIEVSLT